MKFLALAPLLLQYVVICCCGQTAMAVSQSQTLPPCHRATAQASQVVAQPSCHAPSHPGCWLQAPCSCSARKHVVQQSLLPEKHDAPQAPVVLPFSQPLFAALTIDALARLTLATVEPANRSGPDLARLCLLRI